MHVLSENDLSFVSGADSSRNTVIEDGAAGFGGAMGAAADGAIIGSAGGAVGALIGGAIGGLAGYAVAHSGPNTGVYHSGSALGRHLP